MNKSAPNHIKEYCYKDNSDSFYLNLVSLFEGENSFVYKLRCICNCEKFIVYQDAHPSVYAKCCSCGRMITVYDLIYYPAAVKLKKKFSLKKFELTSVPVYVNYEYADEFLYEEDVDFDENVK